MRKETVDSVKKVVEVRTQLDEQRKLRERLERDELKRRQERLKELGVMALFEGLRDSGAITLSKQSPAEFKTVPRFKIGNIEIGNKDIIVETGTYSPAIVKTDADKIQLVFNYCERGRVVDTISAGLTENGQVVIYGEEANLVEGGNLEESVAKALYKPEKRDAKGGERVCRVSFR